MCRFITGNNPLDKSICLRLVMSRRWFEAWYRPIPDGRYTAMIQYSAVQGNLSFIGYASKQMTRYICRSTRAPSICIGFLMRITG